MARKATGALIALALCQACPVEAQPLERRLVRLRSQALTHWAEADPSFDYTTYLPRRYTLSGVDPALLLASASSGGLPVRLLGVYRDDRVEVAAANLRLEPPLLPLTLQARNAWRGVVQVRNGGREFAVLPGQWSASRPEASAGWQDGLYRLTAWTQAGQTRLADATYLGPAPAPGAPRGPLVAILGEGFLERSIELYRSAHPQQFSWKDPSGTAGFSLQRVGLTTLGGLRCFARLEGQLGVFGKVVEGEWEAPLSLRLQQGWLRLQLLPQGQQARLVSPFFAEVPGDWSDAIVGLLQKVFSDELAAVPIPGVYLQQLLASGLVTLEEMERLQVAAWSWGDRRSSCLILQEAGSPAGAPAELGRLGAQGFALGVGAPALNRCLATWLPAQLPLKAELPADRVPSPQILIFKLRLRQLEVQKVRVFYQDSRFVFEDAEVAVHWSLGPLSGVEPGARLSGYASPVLTPGGMGFKLSITRLDFLSPQILKQSAAEQGRLRQQILEGLEKMPVPLPVSPHLLTPVHPKVGLQLQQMRCEPDRLWLEGRWAE